MPGSRAFAVFKRLLLLAAVAAALVLGAAAFAWSTFQARLEPVEPGADAPAERVVIPPGASTARIGALLEARGLIQDARVFRYYAEWQGLSAKLKAGEYELSRGMSVPEILDMIVSGRVVTERVTVREGLTVNQIIEEIAQHEQFSAEKLRAAIDRAAATWPYLPENADLLEPLEGYLFPDTYMFTSDTTEEDLVAMMLARFEAVFDATRRQRAEERGMTVHEVMTLASIIERETPLVEERPLVSAVYHNRLARGMRLDADPTVLYANGKVSGPLTRTELQIDSPYNTYRTNTLPPGPIANAGVTAIDAALEPADVDYLFFVSKFDGTGAHVFAKTYAEHQQNVRRYRDGR